MVILNFTLVLAPVLASPLPLFLARGRVPRLKTGLAPLSYLSDLVHVGRIKKNQGQVHGRVKKSVLRLISDLLLKLVVVLVHRVVFVETFLDGRWIVRDNQAASAPHEHPHE